MSEPLDLNAVALLRRERVSSAAPQEARDRVSRRLAATFPAFAAGAAAAPSPDASSVGVAHGTVARSGLSAMRAIAVSFIVGGAVGVSLLGRVASPPRVVYVDRPIPIPVAQVEPPTPSALPSTPEAPPPPPPLATTSASPSAPVTVARTPKARLDAERALLDGARSALAHGDSRGALDALERHEHLYAQPMLGEEREALTVEALVRSGRYDEARARADTFRRTTPTSIFLSVVEASIRSIP
jgi:hypothetical protein